MTRILRENLSFEQAGMVIESIANDASDPTKGKSLYMRGTFIEGDIRNLNERVYPVHEIRRAVEDVRNIIQSGHSVLGELDHPEQLTINLDRVSHIITDMWMDGRKGIGKLKILDTPMGQIARTLLEADVKLGVSSRGSGNVTDGGNVSDFQIITVDIVARPSAPNAYPTPVYEALNMSRRGAIVEDLATAVKNDHAAQKYLAAELRSFIDSLR